MPELPEVQTVVDDLVKAGLPGAVIAAADVFWPRTIAGLPPADFCTRIRGQKIHAIARRGKYIVFHFNSKNHMLVHLRMTGHLHLAKAKPSQPQPHVQVVFMLEDGRALQFIDTRKFGRIWLTQRPADILERLGPEPLAKKFTAGKLATALGAHRRMLKPLLLDQSFIAGLGNIYVDEALWAAGIHPERISTTLSNQEIKALHRAIRRVLRRGLKNLGTSLGEGRTNFYSVARRRGRNRDQLRVFRREKMPCPRCQTPIQKMLVSQRGTHICPVCQKI